jgi:hypothetical protein
MHSGTPIGESFRPSNAVDLRIVRIGNQNLRNYEVASEEQKGAFREHLTYSSLLDGF